MKIQKISISLTYILILFFISVFIFNTLSFLFLNNTFMTSDIDSEIYFGQRLLKGELLYIEEFHDKFPFVQYLFSVPALFNSIKVWVIISAISIIFTSFYLYKYLINFLFIDWNLNNKTFIRKVAFLISIFFLYCSSILDDSLLHINLLAANLSLLSSLSLLITSSKKNNNNYSYLFSALTSAASISIRPYFLPLSFLLVFWIEIRKLIIKERKISFYNFLYILLNSIKWLFVVFLFGIFLNALPYIFTGNFNSFLQGVLLIGSNINQSTILENLINQFNEYIRSGNVTSLLLSSILLGLICFISSYKNKLFKNKMPLKKLVNLDLMIGSVIFLIILEITLISKHFWNHYYILFIPYIILSLSFSIIYICNFKYQKLKFSEFSKILVLIFLLTILVKTDIRSSLKNASDIFKSHFQQRELELVTKYIENRNKTGLSSDFFYPESMFIHWKLRESRHGFPNEGVVNHIKMGWWENLETDYLPNSIKSKKEYCEKLIENSPSIIFSRGNSFEFKCLKNSNNIYSKDLIDEKLDLYSFSKNQ